MPGFDGTGPAAMGPMTGGGFGSCNPSGWGRRSGMGKGYGPCGGLGRGYGRGFGRGRNFRSFGGEDPVSVLTRDEEIGILKARAGEAESMMKAINRRIQALENEQQNA